MHDPSTSLLSAAKLAARLLGTGNAAQDFDEIADWFYAETHVVRPGRSVPLEMAGERSDADRERIYREWIAGKFKAARRDLASAIAAVEAEAA